MNLKEFFEKNKTFLAIIIGAVIIAGGIYLVGSRPKPTQLPAQLPSVVNSGENSALNTDCLIKGNISSGGKIYHMPGGQFYDRTVINTSKGEKWFCSEVEAKTAGWRKSSK
ncbi:MAG: hypothetical protein AAB757_00975 [Patescibacteria group bacterium]